MKKKVPLKNKNVNNGKRNTAEHDVQGILLWKSTFGNVVGLSSKKTEIDSAVTATKITVSLHHGIPRPGKCEQTWKK